MPGIRKHSQSTTSTRNEPGVMDLGIMELRQFGQMWVGAFMASMLAQLFSNPIGALARNQAQGSGGLCMGAQEQFVSPVCLQRESIF